MTSKKFFLPLLISTALFMFCMSMLLVPTIRAQEASVAALKTDLVLEKARLDEEIALARQSYNQSLEKYRSEERLREIALDQYTSLKTLAALDELVLKTKNLALTRNQVLIHYFTLLKLNLLASEGLELSLQSQYLSTLDLGIEFLTEHSANLQAQNTKDEIQASLVAFGELGDPKSFGDKVLALLALARLQRIYDLAMPLKTDIIESYTADGNKLGIDPSTLARAEIETNKTLQSSQENLQLLWTKAKEPGDLSNMYRNLSRDLEPVYVNLSQALAYLKELLSF